MDQPGQKSSVPSPHAIHHELRTAENSAAYLLGKLQAMKQRNPDLTVLDVGAGSGTISVTLAKAVPEGRVTAIDLNKDVLPRAQAVAELAGVSNIEFQQADAYKLPFADSSFDVTHCHQVLYSLKSPLDALREMLRVTKPGGIVAVRDGDVQTEAFWPELPGIVSYHKLIVDFIKASGGSDTAGRQLLSWALQVGVPRDQITMSYGTWCYNTAAEKQIWGKSNYGRFLVTVGR
jgi:SAM-dependent methyltransferase